MTKVYNKTPFVVLNLLHRSKMDANRDINAATEGLAFASAVYSSYHDALQSRCEAARRHSPTHEALLLDIHGYAPLINATTIDTSWIMLGHLVPAGSLRTQPHSDSNLTEKDEEWIRGSSWAPCWKNTVSWLNHRRGKRFHQEKSTSLVSIFLKSTGKRGRTIQLEFPRPMRENLNHVAPKTAQAVMELLECWNMVEHSERPLETL